MDYQAIKQTVPIEKAATFLGIELKREGDKYRCHCPACEKDRVLIITPSKNAWYCHALQKGGDCIYLVAHIKGIKQSEAAKLLQDAFMREPEKPKRAKRVPTNRGKNSNTISRSEEMEQWEAFIGRL